MKVLFSDYKGKERKPLVKAIEEITKTKAKYSMSPVSYAYIFIERQTFQDSLALEHNGTLHADKETIEALAKAGFIGEIEGEADSADVFQEEGDNITIEIPKNGTMSDEKMTNLLKLAESRHTLLTKALGSPLVIQDGGDTVRFVFPYSEEVGIGEIYSQFAYGLFRYARKHQRVTAVEREVESEKFSMRTYLLKIGMIGGEYSACRRYFMRNLSGNASFATNAKYEEMQASRRKIPDTTETTESEDEGDE